MEVLLGAVVVLLHGWWVRTGRRRGRTTAQAGDHLDEALLRHPTLSSEQCAALHHLCDTGGSLRLVSGMAGTGKSHLLGVAHEVWTAQSLQVVGAASGLQHEAAIPSQTLHRLLYAVREGRIVLDARTVVVIDEAGMVGTRMLQAVEAGGPFGALVTRFRAAELKDIRRQHEPWARQAVHDMATGEAAEALNAFAERGFVHLVDEPETQLVEMWQRSGGLILAGMNDKVARLNLAAQATRSCDAPPIVHARGCFVTGDRVLFTRNHAKLGVFNGDLGTITSGADSVVEVSLDHGKTVSVDLKHYESLRLGYAVTTHKAQGLTADATLILTGPMQDRELSYVQASRARHRTEFFGPEQPLDRLAERMARSRRKLLASDLGPQLKLELGR